MGRNYETYPPDDEFTVRIDRPLPPPDTALPPDLAEASAEDAKRIAKFKLSMIQD